MKWVQSAFTGDFVASFTSYELVLWPVPSLDLEVPPNGRIRALRSGSAPNLEVIVFPYPFVRRPKKMVPLPPVFVAVGLSSSQPHLSFPITMDVTMLTSESSDNTESSRYRVDVMRHRLGHHEGNQLDVAFVLETIYSLPSSLHPYTLYDQRLALEPGYSSKDLRVGFRDDEPLILSVLSVMTQRNTDSGRTTGNRAALTILHWVQNNQIQACMLCSASGRSVYLVKREGETKLQGFVVDYLPIAS